MTNVNLPKISIVGLPASGKTTFLAALWHLIQSGEIETRLRYASMGNHDYAYLNSILKLWRSATEQKRTQLSGAKSIGMNLHDRVGRQIAVAFPDMPGEDYRRMWEERRVDQGLANSLASSNIMLLLNGDRVRAPAWVMERTALEGKLGVEPAPEEPVEWHSGLAPTQVQLVDLLQNLMRAPLDRGLRRIAVMIGAWDKVEGEGKSPSEILTEKLPLLDQYLKGREDQWATRVYGLSAQGGEFDRNDENESGAPPRQEAERLRAVAIASQRIRLVLNGVETHDLTEPLEWLM